MSGAGAVEVDGVAFPTWGAFHAAAERVGSALRSAGVGAGHVVAVEGTTSAESVLAVFGAWRAGAAVTVLPTTRRRPELAAHELARRCARLRITGAVLQPGAWAHVPRGVREGLAAALTDAEVRAAAEDAGPGSRAASTAPALAAWRDGGFAPHAVAVQQATSGTTGPPRFVPMTWAMLDANLRGLVDRLGVDERASVVSWLPLFHDMGLILYLLLAASLGARLALVPTPAFAADPATLAAVVERRAGTLSGAPTYGLSLLERGLARAPAAYRLGSLRRIVCGAEMVDLRVCERLVAAGARHGLREDVLAFGYGLAEATLAVSLRAPSRPADAEDLVPPGDGSASWCAPGRRGFARLGPPLAGVGVRVRAADGRVAATATAATTAGVTREPAGPGGDGVVGEVEVGGPSVMAGYAGGGDEGGGPLTPDGWLRTGDLGYLRDGELVVVGRSKDVIVVGGRNVTPSDIEAVVGELAGVRRGRVVAVQAEGRAGEGFAVLAEQDGDRDVDERAVRRALRSEMELSPERVLLLPRGAIPVTTSGKLQRSRCRRLLADPARPPMDRRRGEAG